MEIEVKLNTWKYLTEQMEACKRTLLKSENMLEEYICEARRHTSNEEMVMLNKRVEKYKEELTLQRKHMEEMVLALKRIGEYYMGCEEQVLEFGEESRVRFSEEIEVMDLKEWNVMPVLLKKK